MAGFAIKNEFSASLEKLLNLMILNSFSNITTNCNLAETDFQRS